MKKNSLVDYFAFILLKIFGPLFRALPVNFCYFLGRSLGYCLYHFDRRHRAIAFSNIKEALGNKFTPAEISDITKSFYQSFGQSIIEVFLIPRIDKEYLKKYVEVTGVENIRNAFKKGKGVILLVVHECGWELSNIVAASLGFSFNVIVRDQGLPMLNGLLNKFRREKGAKVIARGEELRQLIAVFKNNEAVAMTLDQGGAAGELVKFFGRSASMSTGAIKLALKYDAELLPVFFERVGGPYSRVIIEEPMKIEKGADAKENLRSNLQMAIGVFEKHIASHPKEYLWTYKIWKYSDLKRILLLSDGKTGHLRQLQAVKEIILKELEERKINAEVLSETVDFKNKTAKAAFALRSCFATKFNCQSYLRYLQKYLKTEVYNKLILYKPDIVVSCGSSAVGANYIIARSNLAKSIVIMRPGLLSAKKFDLVIAPKHDNLKAGKNLLQINGALNLINDDYLKTHGEMLKDNIPDHGFKALYIGLLMGGDTKKFTLIEKMVNEVVLELKKAADELDAGILMTTSRRTPEKIEKLLKNEFKNYKRAKLQIIANENNLPQAVGGILSLSRIIIISPESISMISEAASSGKAVLVFDMPGLSKRHKIFLKNLSGGGYIHLTKTNELAKNLKILLSQTGNANKLNDGLLVREALKGIL